MNDKQISTDKILLERFSQLPEVIQDIILESNWKNVLRRITSTYKLHIDQGGNLEAITLLTMLGLEDSDEYISNLEKEVKITRVLATEIAKIVEVDIFQKIREAVMKKTTKDEDKKPFTPPRKIDPYREDVGDVEIIEEKNDKENIDEEKTKRELSKEIDVLDLNDESDKVEMLNRDELLHDVGDEGEVDGLSFTPKVDTDLQREIEGGGQKMEENKKNKIDPIHMRTLKSDIVRQKLANPSWVPKIAKKDIVSRDTKNIIDDAKKDYENKTNIRPEIR